MSKWTNDKIKERLDYMRTDIETNGRAFKGKKDLLRFVNGEKLTQREAIRAFCYQCMGYQNNPGEDPDCENPVCPLYTYFPYSKCKTKIRKASEKTKLQASENIKKNRLLKKK